MNFFVIVFITFAFLFQLSLSDICKQCKCSKLNEDLSKIEYFINCNGTEISKDYELDLDKIQWPPFQENIKVHFSVINFELMYLKK